MIRRPPRSTHTDTLFPYATLFRSLTLGKAHAGRLIERDIAFNSGHGEFNRKPPLLLEKVMAHEFGHAIGLTHSTQCGDVMTLAADCPGVPDDQLRSEDRRVGKECVSKCKSGVWTCHYKKKTNKT